MFLTQAQFFYGDVRRFYSDGGGPTETRFTVTPGFGLHGGIGFRLTRLLSLDFNIGWKRTFISTGKIGLYAKYDNGNADTLIFNKGGIYPYTFGGSLGITLWLPR